ncbi:MAG: hypothetical protein IIV64_03385, partial [Muribaculaceae bacterium]|nr:hypothetical protein [Muribaculaceae bacterium]
VKKNVLNILKEQYGIEESDFLSAELEVVPAGKARDLALHHISHKIPTNRQLASVDSEMPNPKLSGYFGIINLNYPYILGLAIFLLTL